MSRSSRLLKRAAASLATLALSLLAAVGVAELALRLHQYRTYGISLLNDAGHGLYSRDDTLGWKMSPNLRYTTELRDALGAVSKVTVGTNGEGFRSYGDPASRNAKLFFVGDSFTAAVDVSDGKTYHHLVGELLGDAEVFAYGAGGYGSLQEYLILDAHLERIRPAAVVLQFYENDFLDNDPALDMIKSLYNTGTPRPYLEADGSITRRYATHGGLFWTLPAPITDNLRLLKFLNTRLTVALSRRPGRAPATEEIARSGAAHEGFRRAAATTRRIMAMFRDRAGAVPVYLFCLTDNPPYLDAIREICRDVGIGFIEGVHQGLAEREQKTPNATKAGDREHLNETGNRVVAERLARFLRESGVVQAPAR